MSGQVVNPLSFDQLKEAVAGPAAAIRLVQRLEPAGGASDKVFPPTYAGGIYAAENRHINDRPVRCVLLDSVQSQANRLEQALLQATDGEDGLRLPLLVVDFSKEFPEIGRITSLDAPHRIADAIFRDSLIQGKPFRESTQGKAFEAATVRNATALFDLCPTALIFGTWDSTGTKGGSGNKFARALVSEIVGVDVSFGVRTSSRIDPLAIEKCEVYEAAGGDWTTDPAKAVKDEKGNFIKFGKNKETRGKPSALNHGNVTPDVVRYAENVNVPDWLKASDANDVTVRQKEMAVGGVTMAYALQTTVLSLPALRRLRFPDERGTVNSERDRAARAVLAALALTAIALQREQGYFLRSRCDLIPIDEASFEVVSTAARTTPFRITSAEATNLLKNAVSAARDVKLPWRTEPLQLTPKPALVELVRKSRELVVEEEQ